MASRKGLLWLDRWERDVCWLVAAMCVCLAGTFAAAQDEPPERSVIARVDGEPVLADEVDRELRAAYGVDFEVASAAEEIRRQAAEQVVRRRLVLKYLQQSKQGVSEQDVALALEQLKSELKAQGTTYEEYLRRGGWREEDFRRHLTWMLSWRKFLERTLTEANLEKYFDSHRADFDGREVRVAHLLLKVAGDDSRQREERVAEAARIRKEIEAGRITFAEAVKRYSEAPTATQNGGDLGFIRRHEPMPEAFSRVTLGLEVGAVSEPVVTPFGVHLIQCLEVRPGKKAWRDSESEVRKAVTLYLFEWAAERQKAKSKVEWTSSGLAESVGTR